MSSVPNPISTDSKREIDGMKMWKHARQKLARGGAGNISDSRNGRHPLARRCLILCPQTGQKASADGPSSGKPGSSASLLSACSRSSMVGGISGRSAKLSRLNCRSSASASTHWSRNLRRDRHFLAGDHNDGDRTRGGEDVRRQRMVEIEQLPGPLRQDNCVVRPCPHHTTVGSRRGSWTKPTHNPESRC